MTAARLAVLNAALDAAIDHRLTLHHARGNGDLDVRPYKDGLAAVRDVEDVLEPLRRKAGARHTRAYELSVEDTRRQLDQEVA